MARKRTKNEKQSHIIFVLISAISDEFYVGKTTAATPKVAYKFHATAKHARTKDLFTRSRESQKFPRMFLLEEVNDTPKVAFGHCVAWTKYFIEKSLTPLAYEKVLLYAEELTEANEAIYNRIKDLPLGDVLGEDRVLVSDYTAQVKRPPQSEKKTTNRECIISIRVTPDHYELLTYKAKEAKMSLSKYCQTAAVNGQIIKVSAWEYAQEIRGFKRVLQQILLAILQHGKYYPADINNVFKLLKKVTENQGRVSRTMDQQVEKVIGYKKLKLENYRLKQRIKELESKERDEV